MAATYTLIESYTVGAGGASSVTLGSGGTIPQTYTDLIVLSSPRDAGSGTAWEAMKITINADATAGNYSGVSVYGFNSSTGSQTGAYGGYIEPGGNTANVFASNQLYFPNYTSSNYKTTGWDGVTESNNAGNTQILLLGANLWQSTAAITSIKFQSLSGANIVQYSTFYLYGIKNS